MKLQEPTDELFDLVSSPGRIKRTQTTYIDVVPDRTGERSRIHFGIALRRSRLDGNYSRGEISDSHPLGILFDERRAWISFHRGPNDAGRFLNDLYQSIDGVFGSWVDPEEFMNRYFTEPTNLPSRTSGELMRGPAKLIRTVAPVLKIHGLAFKLFEYDVRQPKTWVLTLDRMFVVVTGFAVERLPVSVSGT